MKVLHTADWHIGKTLFGQKRYDEFEAFLSWLSESICEQEVDVLLVAGDVFDTCTPSNRAQQLYYRFLCRVANSPCRHVIITAGNHDSPSFLNAPKELLHSLDVHVVGATTRRYEDEVILLKDQNGAPELIVCAVPYLRDGDIRISEPGESIEDKERKLIDGIRRHYSEVCKVAENMRSELAADIPIIAMGHLFTAGGKTIDGDGVRGLYVGSLAVVTSAIFPACIDYLALGHLHIPQKVNGSEVIRYCGSPIPMGFGEAKQEKNVCLIEFKAKEPSVTEVKVPVFQHLAQIKGSWDEIAARISELSAENHSMWLEVIYEGDEFIADLSKRLEDACRGTQLEILNTKGFRKVGTALEPICDSETLDDLTEQDVFGRCLQAYSIPLDQWPELTRAYNEALLSILEDDSKAE